MRLIDSQALDKVSKALGVAASPQLPYLDDGVLQQVLDVTGLVRRARALGAAGGVFAGSIDTVHAAADTVNTTVDPYQLTSPGAGYPSPVPDGYDVWLLDAQVAVTIGACDDNPGPRLSILYPSASRFLGGAGNVTVPWRLFSTEVPTSAVVAYLRTADGFTQKGPTRIPRGAQLVFGSTSLAATTVFGILTLGLWPEALGAE